MKLDKITEKQVEGDPVTIYRDIAHAFYVGKKTHGHLDQFPMGAFRSLEAAKRWADREFPGGDWTGR